MKEGTDFLTLRQLTGQHFTPVGWYLETFQPDFAMAWHVHQQFEIMYCQRGAFTFEYLVLPDGEKACFTIPEKHFIFVNTGYYHRIRIDVGDTLIYNVELYPTSGFDKEETETVRKVSLPARELFAVSPQLEELKEKNEPFTVFNDSQDVGGILKRMIEELNDTRTPTTVLSTRVFLLKLFIDISRCTYGNMRGAIKLSYVRKAMFYIQRNFGKPLSIEEIAAQVGITPAHLNRLFKADLGQSIYAALTAVRIKNAKNLLKNTSLSHAEISKLSGFASRERMIYAFRTIEGCSPRDYRRICREKTFRAYPWPSDVELL